jgi:hypothetical protein
MASIVEVKLWGVTIGHLGYSPGQKEYATFEYDEQFVNSAIEQTSSLTAMTFTF